MRKATTLQISRQAFEKAVAKAQPVTVSYMQEEKDKTGKRTGRKDAKGNLVLTETVRTIEPYEVAETKAGNLIVKAMDRATGERRTFRLDRMVSWTTHRTAFLVKRPTNLKEVVMAKDTGAPVSEAGPKFSQGQVLSYLPERASHKHLSGLPAVITRVVDHGADAEGGLGRFTYVIEFPGVSSYGCQGVNETELG